MELTKDQYELIKPSIERYKQSVKHKFSVYNQTDVRNVQALKAQLGIESTEGSCASCSGLIWAKEVFQTISDLVEKYELQNQDSNTSQSEKNLHSSDEEGIV